MKGAGSFGVLMSEANESREDAAGEGAKIPLAAGAEAPATAQGAKRASRNVFT